MKVEPLPNNPFLLTRKHRHETLLQSLNTLVLTLFLNRKEKGIWTVSSLSPQKKTQSNSNQKLVSKLKYYSIFSVSSFSWYSLEHHLHVKGFTLEKRQVFVKWQCLSMVSSFNFLIPIIFMLLSIILNLIKFNDRITSFYLYLMFINPVVSQLLNAFIVVSVKTTAKVLNSSKYKPEYYIIK